MQEKRVLLLKVLMKYKIAAPIMFMPNQCIPAAIKID